MLEQTGNESALMLTAPSKPPTSSAFVADQLRDAILRGAIPPGTRLRQAQLAHEFGVSTTPVREAFQILQSEGIVESDPHRGVVVRRPSAADVAEDY
jgi:DNA-binding GntR family transcriptional regulator